LRASSRILAGLTLLALAGCSPQLAATGAVANAGASSATVGHEAVASTDSENQRDDERLEALWNERTRENLLNRDFTLGPGDEIEINVPEIEDLKDREVRVSGENTISLPLLGDMNVTGMTEQGLSGELKRALGKYMYNPRVSVFVKAYESREVAVIGIVQKPGLYTLTSPSETVLSVIGRAGGATENAASQIMLVPSASNKVAMSRALIATDGVRTAARAEQSPSAGASQAEGPSKPNKINAVQPTDGYAATPEPTVAGLQEQDPIVIDLRHLTARSHLDVPVRPGDVVIVPAAGEVMVKGWVNNAGAFKVTPGMTVLGAVSAAGGEMFSSSAEILRTGESGDRKKISVDLQAIQSGESPDIPVQTGDVVVVDRSLAGAVPYALYTILTRFGTGIYPAF
jgi:protein involved in polysaccharide export with SLBB domain